MQKKNDRKHRIFFLITSSNFGGAETLLYNQVRHLNKEKFEVLVCSIKSKGMISQRLEQHGTRVESIDFDIHQIWKTPLQFVKKISILKNLIRNFQPDIVQTSLFQANVMGAIIGTFLKVPVRIATVHMVLKKRIFEPFVERLLSPFITKYIAVSEDIRHFYVEKLLLAGAKIQVIYNGVDENKLVELSREEVPVNDILPSPRIVMIGRLDGQKNIQVLLKAVSELLLTETPVGLLLIGEGPKRDSLEKLTRALKIDSHARFLGYLGNPMPFLATSEALVLSSSEEGLPIAILEAMALKKPVVATAVGAVPEIVKNQQTGYLVPPEDPGALANAIANVIKKPDLSKKMGEEGHKLFQERFSIHATVKQLESLYSTLMHFND